MPGAINFTDFEWKYENTTEFALKGVNLSVEQNTFTGIVGANEHGKTSLVQAMNGLIPHSYNGIYRGSVEVFGKPVKELDSLALASQVGLVFSDPESQFSAMTVEEELTFGMENLGFDLQKIKERVEWAADITMISDLLDKSPYDISGGQKQRVAIACVLAMNPPVIILDEPTSMIDPLGKNFIFQILRTLKEEGNHTLIVVEHNIEQLAPLADQMILMYDGNVDKTAPPHEFFNDSDYLIERGIRPPESTAFVKWLRDEGHISPGTILPLDSPQAARITQLSLENRS